MNFQKIIQKILKNMIVITDINNDGIQEYCIKKDETISALTNLFLKCIGDDREIGEMRYGGCNPDEDRGYNIAKEEIRKQIKKRDRNDKM